MGTVSLALVFSATRALTSAFLGALFGCGGIIPNNRAAGDRFERRVRGLLESRGWWVIRAAGSHGIADLVAIRAGITLLVQAKISGRLSPAEWNGLVELGQKTGARPIMVERPSVRSILWWELLEPRARRALGSRSAFSPD